MLDVGRIASPHTRCNRTAVSGLGGHIQEMIAGGICIGLHKDRELLRLPKVRSLSLVLIKRFELDDLP